MPDHIFRAYDIRGIAAGDDPEITPELAQLLGRAFGQCLRARHPAGARLRVAVGRDHRLSGDALSAALIGGLTMSGVDVFDIHYATSPYLYFAVCAGEYDGGISLTASHNPPEYNGFKLTREMAIPVAGDEIQQVLAIMKELDGVAPAAAVGSAQQADLTEQYFGKLGELCPVARPLRVVLDAGNGTAGIFAPELFRRLGCEVTELYCEPDGTFPNHPANPEEVATLQDLQAKVLEIGADIGIAYDGDGDRCGIVDETGAVIPADRLLILLARDVLGRHAGAEVLFDVKCSNVLAAEIEKAGGIATRWKTGHSFMKQKMRESGALLAGEVSGHIFFAEDYFGVDDGILASAKISSILSQSGRSLSSYFADLPASCATPELKLPIADAVKFETMKDIIADFSSDFRSDLLDGVRFSWADGSWGIIRASNTSPYLTARLESSSDERLAEIVAETTERLTAYPNIDISSLSALQ